MASATPKPTVAFLGLGAMGFAMSTHLVRTSFPVVGFDIYPPTLERWTKTCSDISNSTFSTASSPAEAVASPGVSVVVLMVATSQHVDSALFDAQIGAVKALPKGCTIIIMSTVPPTHPSEVRERLTNEFGRSDVRLIDAPVSGGTARSINGTLTIMASSDNPENLEIQDVKSLLSNLASTGNTLYTIPGTLGAGTSAKALNQVQCGIHIVSASEIMGLAAVLGLNTQAFYDTLTTSASQGDTAKTPLGYSWMFANRGPRMLSATPPMASATSIINKDVNIILAEEERLSVSLPLLNAASEVLHVAMDSGLASADDSALVKFYLSRDDLEGEKANLVVRQADASYKPSAVVDGASKLASTESTPLSDTEAQSLTQTVALAHSLIHLISAYETITFAQSLDLMGPEQRRRWFDIIAGAAGGSTVFGEVIPRIFEQLDASQSGSGSRVSGAGSADPTQAITIAVGTYVAEKFAGGVIDHIEQLIEAAQIVGYDPTLLKVAVRLGKEILGELVGLSGVLDG